LLQDKKILPYEKGIALIAVLQIALVLSLLAIALSYRAGLFITETKGLYIKNQDIYSSEVGLEEIRYYLWENNCVPPNWICSGFPTLNQNDYTEVTSPILTNLFNQTTQINTGTFRITYVNNDIIFEKNLGSAMMEVDRFRYQIFAKTTNIPRTLNVLSSSERVGQQTKTIIESALIFTVPCQDDYKQFGQCSSKEGLSGEVVSSGAGTPTVRTVF